MFLINWPATGHIAIEFFVEISGSRQMMLNYFWERLTVSSLLSFQKGSLTYIKKLKFTEHIYTPWNINTIYE